MIESALAEDLSRLRSKKRPWSGCATAVSHGVLRFFTHLAVKEPYLTCNH